MLLLYSKDVNEETPVQQQTEITVSAQNNRQSVYLTAVVALEGNKTKARTTGKEQSDQHCNFIIIQYDGFMNMLSVQQWYV